MLNGILLDSRGLQHTPMTAYRLVGLGHHSHHVIAVLNQQTQGLDCELRRPHEYDSQITLIHSPLY